MNWARGLAGACLRLGIPMRGMYVAGSAAMGDFDPGRSDVDLVLVVARHLTEQETAAVLDLLGRSEPPPGRGLDLVIFAHPDLRRPGGSPSWWRWIRWDAGRAPVRCERPDADLVPELAAARDHAVPITGPDPAEVFGPIPRSTVLSGCIAATAIRAARDPVDQPASAILNACRAWMFWEQAELAGKRRAGEWASSRVDDPSVIRRALAHDPDLTEAGAKDVVADVLARIRGRSPVLDRLSRHDVLLRDGDLVLRPLTEHDWPLLERWNRNPTVLWYSDGDDVNSRSGEEVRALYRAVSQDALCFVIEVDGHPIGETWLQLMNLERVLARHPQADCRRIDIMIGEPSYWGRGLGTRTIALLTRYGFEVERADAIFGCDIGDRNPRSLAAFRRSGYTVDHVEPDAVGPKDEHCVYDVVRYRG